MCAEHDTFVKRLAKKNVAVWTARAEMARKAGNSLLLKKALKWKARYEQELMALENIEAEAMARHEPTLAAGECQADPDGWCLCALFEHVFGAMDYDFDASRISPDLVRQCVDSLEISLADLEGMETSMEGLPVCERCRTQQDKMLSILQALRKGVQKES
ncbi:MAG: hypothetical protein JSS86_03995 [Cyanobacteria bacterium SZAS LIN-2]|nr:hypothetical protein [Cyanobacteria bacterium SZAS LIN-2]